jgi:hypothetical protein
MKFAIFREVKISGDKVKRKFLVEWSQDEIIKALQKELIGMIPSEYQPEDVARNALNNIVKDFKKESLKIP